MCLYNGEAKVEAIKLSLVLCTLCDRQSLFSVVKAESSQEPGCISLLAKKETGCCMGDAATWTCMMQFVSHRCASCSCGWIHCADLAQIS